MKKNRLAIPAVSLAALLAAGAACADYVLIYDANAGTLSIDTDGDILYTYVIEGSTTIPSGGFLKDNAILLPGTSAPTFTAEVDELAATNLTGWRFDDPTSLGEVLPKHLTPQQFDDAITTLHYVDEFGGQAKFDFSTQYVPEPASLVLLGTGLAMLMQRRKR